jgi:hypothetical protein
MFIYADGDDCSLCVNPNEGLCGQIPNIDLRAIASLYIEHVPLIWNIEEKEARDPILHRVYCVFSVVLMERETSTLQLLAPLPNFLYFSP